jgi:hypothetical protein
MTTFLAIVVIVLAVGALVSLVRGIVIFLKSTERDLLQPGTVSQSGLAQNRMMWRRIQFQAGAVLVAVLMMYLARG